MNKGSKKEAIIIAGANGSGKTTFAKKFLNVTNYKFLNADEFAKTISPENPDKAKIQAGKKVINSLKDIIEEQENFVIESTLSGNFLKKYITLLKEKSFEVNLTFIYLGAPHLCIERIKSRVILGGHNVPDEDVKRRYLKGLYKFWTIYKDLADYYSIVVNNEYFDFKRIAQGSKEKIEILDTKLYKSFKQEIIEVNNGI